MWLFIRRVSSAFFPGAFVCAVTLGLAGSMANTEPVAAAAEGHAGRSIKWAERVTVKGAPNLHKVDTNFYRSAQPSRDGFAALATSPGIKTDINLRAFHRDDKLVRGLDITLVSVPIHTWHIETEDVVTALRAIRQGQKRGPVLLHCQHGADRTGLVTALYRILYQGWTKEDALAEMKDGEFGYHAIWGNIPTFLAKVDVASLKAAVDAP